MQITQADLDKFTGTEAYYNVYGIKVTDGIKFLMDNGHYWLVTDIASFQSVKFSESLNYGKEYIKDLPFQVWILKVTEHSAVLTLQEDSDAPILFTKKYDYTDSPFKELKLWLINGVLILPSEY